AAALAPYGTANGLALEAATATELIGLRAIAGFVAGANLVSARLYVAQVADRARLSFANSICSAASSAGIVAGPAIGGLLAAAFTLRAPFVAVAATSAVAFVAALWL